MITTERGKDESAKAYAAFKLYAEMGAGRSLAAVAKKLAKSEQLIRRWSMNNGWKERTRLWDDQAENRQDEADKAAEHALALDRAKRRQRVQDAAWDLFVKLKEKADDMLKFPVGTRESVDGKTTIRPAKWNFADLARIATVADQLGRLATGLATGRTELTGPDGGPIPTTSQALPPIVFKFSNDEDTRRAVAEFDGK